MKLLVTGSSGLIGSEVVRHFDGLGWNVHGVDNNMRAEFFGPGGDTRWNQHRLEEVCRSFRHHELDIRDRAAVLRIVEQLAPDVIVHTAAQPSHDLAASRPFDDFDVNAVGTLNLLEATREHVPEAVFAHMSTNKVYGDAPNELPLDELETRWEYASAEDWNGIREDMRIDQSKHSLFGASKVAADVMVQEYGRYFGLKTCCMRGGCLTGPHHSGVELHGFLSYLVKVNLEGGVYRVFGYKGKQVRDNIHSFDVARFIEMFIADPRCGEVYNLGGGRDNSCSILEAFSKVEALTGKKMRSEYVDKNREGDHICYISDLSKMKEHYPGWDITKSLDAIFEEIVEAWAEDGARGRVDGYLMTRSKSTERILVTGGAGFIGSRLCLALRSRQPDLRVVALDNLFRRGSELQVPRLQTAGVEFVRGDVRNMEDLKRAGSFDVIVDAAAETSVLAGVAEDPGYVVGSNLIGSINCLELARKTGAGFILLSSSRVYPIEGLRAIELRRVGERFELVDAEEVRGVTGRGVTERFPMDGLRTLYGATKYAAELLAQEFFHMYGIRGVIDRCGVVAGPWQMAKVEQGVVGLWCARHLYGGPLDYIGHDGYQVRDILHVDDLVELLLRQIELLPEITGQVFNVGGGRAISVSLRELTALCQDVTGNEIEIDAVDGERPGDVPWYCSDYSKVESATGWAPTREPREIVEDTCKWITKHREMLRPILGT